MLLLWEHFAIAFSALLPLLNPLGSALIFAGLVGAAPPSVYARLARRIAINTALFFAIIELIGSTILSFFGISLPIVQVSGGLVIAAMGWSLLNARDSQHDDSAKIQAADDAQVANRNLGEMTFYPFTFPITAGPGCIVVMLTLSAHASEKNLPDNVFAHLGVLLAALVLSLLVGVIYAYAPRITSAVSPSTAKGILRVIAFILLCIGVQIAWNGVEPLARSLLQKP